MLNYYCDNILIAFESSGGRFQAEDMTSLEASVSCSCSVDGDFTFF